LQTKEKVATFDDLHDLAGNNVQCTDKLSQKVSNNKN